MQLTIPKGSMSISRWVVSLGAPVTLDIDENSAGVPRDVVVYFRHTTPVGHAVQAFEVHYEYPDERPSHDNGFKPVEEDQGLVEWLRMKQPANNIAARIVRRAKEMAQFSNAFMDEFDRKRTVDPNEVIRLAGTMFERGKL